MNPNASSRLLLQTILASAMTLPVIMAYADDETDRLKRQLSEYEQRLDKLEQSDVATSADRNTTANVFNPAISVVLDGLYASYKNDPEDYALPGFALGGEAELAPEGLSLGHSELIMSSNIDDKFFGQITIALAEHDGELEVELEEAFFETLALDYGFIVRGGRFYSGIGYLNQQHEHAWDFLDAPLVYRGLFGRQYIDDGVRVSYVAPTELFLELGIEALAGNGYPAGGSHTGAGVWTVFTNIGGDVGVSHSWQAGLSYWAGDNIEREYGSHDHGGTAETPLFEGDSSISGLNAVYKWAPGGNYRDQNLKLQFEYFNRDEDGNLTLLNSGPPVEESTLDSQQDGWYAQARWQFAYNWAVSARYDRLDSDNTGSDVDVLDEAGLVTSGHTPERTSIAAEWLSSEYSRIRLQYNRDNSYQVPDNQVYLQYTFSLGAHKAHAY